MSDFLAHRIVNTAREMEEEEKNRDYATMTYEKDISFGRWNIKIPDTSRRTGTSYSRHNSVEEALAHLTKSGFEVDAKEVNAWMRNTQMLAKDNEDMLLRDFPLLFSK